MGSSVASTTTTPFTTSRTLSILNSHYSSYGHSVLTSFESVFPQIQANSQVSSSNGCSAKRGISNASSTTLMLPSAGKTHQDGDSVADPATDASEVKEPKSENKRPKLSYKSLLIDNNVAKFLKKTLIETDSFSLFSSTSSAPLATINQLPLEIMKSIMGYLNDNRALVCCLYVNKAFYKSAKYVLYYEPKLTSTYRVAQLVTSLRENPQNTSYIKVLNLSNLQSGLIVNEKYIQDHQDQFGDMNSIHSKINDDQLYLDYAYASWRDWKYRGDSFYGSSLLNSYNLSKTRSVSSVNSLSTVSSAKVNFLKKFKSDLSDEITLEFGKLRDKFIHFKKGKSRSSSKRHRQQQQQNSSSSGTIRNKPMLHSRHPLSSATPSKSVRFNQTRNPRNQPFHDGHPFTNKFLLKYSSFKDIPIGYVLTFIELCPFLTHIDLSSISLFSDYRIKYQDEIKQYRQFSSLVEDVLPHEKPNGRYRRSHSSPPAAVHRDGEFDHALSRRNTNMLDDDGFERREEEEYFHTDGDVKPKYLSDCSGFKSITTANPEFVKLHESDILCSIAKLTNLKSLNLSSVSWLNYKALREFNLASKSLNAESAFGTSQTSSLKNIDLTNAGMRRGLNWARLFDDVVEFKEYFKNEVEPVVDAANDGDILSSRIGMNY